MIDRKGLALLMSQASQLAGKQRLNASEEKRYNLLLSKSLCSRPAKFHSLTLTREPQHVRTQKRLRANPPQCDPTGLLNSL